MGGPRREQEESLGVDDEITLGLANAGEAGAGLDVGGGPAYSTAPDLMATRQEPQPPARQPASIFTPFSSASARTESCAPVHVASFPLFANLISMVATGPAAASTFTGAFFFTDAGPNASKCTHASGTPQASRSAVIDSMNGPGPQRKKS